MPAPSGPGVTPEHLFTHLDRFGDRAALITPEQPPVTYSDLLAAADRLAPHVTGPCLAFLVCENRVEAIEGYVGLLRAGATVALLLGATDAARLAQLRSRYRPRLIYLPERLAAGVPDAVACATLGEYVLLRTASEADYIIADGLAVLLTTSGSTGSPKFVRLSHRNLLSNAEAIAKYLEIDASDRAITTLPMHYSFGLSVINSHLQVGASLAVTSAAVTEKAFWDFLQSSGATSLSGVPETYRMLARLGFSEMRLPSLRCLTQAGGRLEPAMCAEVAGACERDGRRFFVMYGQTEATARIAYLPWQHARTKAGSIGGPIPGGEMWLEDESGRRIDEVDAEGELVYRGANVALGYAESCDDLGRGDDFAGTLRTGDMAIRDTDGFFSIVGRRSRYAKIFGSRVSLDEVEVLLREAGFTCACTGGDDRLTVHVEGCGLTASVVSAVTARTGIHRAAVRVREIECLPKSPTGKVSYAALD